MKGSPGLLESDRFPPHRVTLDMNRITESFAQLQAAGKKGFIPFITAGDPDLQTTDKLLVVLANAGATVIELGIPFSDPMADGPVIQRASDRALRHGFGVKEILALVAEARKQIDTPIILFSYYNPLLQFGIERLAREAANAGVAGVLITDLAPEESAEVAATLRASGLDLIFLVAPTTTDARLEMIARRASGFIYAVSRAGVTGKQDTVSAAAADLVKRVRRFSDLPVAVGFGISTAEQVEEVWRYADAVVVGSAIVAEIERLGASSELPRSIGNFARKLLPVG